MVAGFDSALADGGGVFGVGWRVAGEFAKAHGGHVNVDVDAINEAEVFRYIPKPWVQEELKEIMDLASVHRDQIVEDKRLADQLRAQLNPISEQEKEAKLLEDSEPGITKVNWGPDGSVRLD